MNSIEQYQIHFKRQSEATLASANDFIKCFQAIATAHADHAPRSFKDGATFLERPGAARSVEEVVEARTEYARIAYEALIAEAKTIRVICAECFKSALNPLGSIVVEPTSQTTNGSTPNTRSD